MPGLAGGAQSQGLYARGAAAYLRDMILPALLLAATLGAAAPQDSVRELHVLVLVYTRSFARTLDDAQMERLHEEIVEFAEFYRHHGGDRVSFRFTLAQLDRELRREEVGQVAPGRYYLSREDVRADVESLGVRDIDEVVAFYAWDNANPTDATLAYGGGAVGPDGQYIDDAGFNSIGVFAFDPARIAQIAIHEVLHNVDDMFTRAGMPDRFFNSDEMSRNMPMLVAERPDAFEPYWSDDEMLAYAERERAGRDAYPWWMQRIYYAWMLERTPAEAWAALHHGRMASRSLEDGVRPLYADVIVSRATRRIFLPALPAGDARASGVTVSGADGTMRPRRWTLEDFDGAPIVEGDWLGGWITVEGRDSVRTVGVGDGSIRLRRLGMGDIVAPERVAALMGDTAAAFEVVAREAAWPERGPVIAGAVVAAVAGETVHRGNARLSVPLVDDPGTTIYEVGATAPGFMFSHARVEAVREAGAAIEAPSTRTGAMGSPLGLRVEVRERRPIEADIVARLDGREVPLVRAADGSHTVRLDALPPGLHDVELIARAVDGTVIVDTTRVYARPTGWIRVPRAVESSDGFVRLDATVRSRMGETMTAQLPLVAIAGARVLPLAFEDGTYRSTIPMPAGEHRLYVTSLTGDFQRRVVRASVTGAAATGRRIHDGFAAVPRLTAPPTIDGVPDDVPGLLPVVIGPSSHLLTNPANYSGAGDLEAHIGFAWSEDGLYASGTVTDDDVTGGEAWDRDRINLVFDWREDTTPLTYGSDNPPTNEWQRDDYWVFFQPFDSEGGPGGVQAIGREGQRSLTGARLASRRTADGYTFELWLPASELPEFVPFEAQVAAMQVFVSDGDSGHPLTELMWSDAWGHSVDGGLSWELWRMGRLVFAGSELEWPSSR